MRTWTGGLVAVMLVLGVAATARGQAVDRVVKALPIGSTSGPPGCAVDSHGNLHVVYSRNNSAQTRSDLFYRMISFDRSSTPWLVDVGDEVCLTEGLGDYDESDPTLSDSFHMAPRVAIDSTDRLHVVFLGYGHPRNSPPGDYRPYHNAIAYFNFPAPSQNDGTVVPSTPVIVARNRYEEDLDPPHFTANTTDSYDELFRRHQPNLCLREVRDSQGALQRVEVHVSFGSTTGDDPSNGWDEDNDLLWDRLDYVRIDVATTGSVTQTRKIHIDDSDNAGYLAAFHSHPFVLPSGKVLLVAGYDRGDYCHHAFLIDPDDTSPVLSTLDFNGGYAGNFNGFTFGATRDTTGTVHVVGWDPDVLRIRATTDDEILLERTEASLSAGWYGSGGGAVFAEGKAQVLGPEGGLHLARSDGTFTVDTERVNAPCWDLSADSNGEYLFAVYAPGISTGRTLQNATGAAPAGNLELTAFQTPDPMTDLVSWISSPEDGAYIANGKVTLTAVDGAAGSAESYHWYDDDDPIGEGASLTTRFRRGVHIVTLRVALDGREADPPDSITIYYGVEPPSEPTPGISVSPTSGLVTTEAGGTATFTVVLDSAPTGDVTIALSSSDEDEGTVSPATLTFTSGNWDTARTVTVTGVDDSLSDGDQTYTILTAPAVSSDTQYSGSNPPDVSVTNTDDDGTSSSGTSYASEDESLPLDLPDEKTVVSTLVVPDGTGTIVSLSVTVAITHDRESDLEVTLISPKGKRETLSGVSGTFTTTSFSAEGLAGTWKLEIRDTKKKKTGTLTAWSITVVT